MISAHFPFKTTSNRGRAPEWNEAAEAFGVLGGGFSLCVQAVLVACDAGAVDAGERVVSMSADTSIVALASRTETFLSAHQGLIVEHIICRPMRYGISKPHHGALDNMGQFGDAAGSRPAQKYIDAVVAGEDTNRLISEIAGTSDDDEGDDLP